MKNKKKRCKAAILLAVILSVLFADLNLYTVRAAETETIVSFAAQILYNNEGSYTSVNPNDNGAVSIGKLQWHGWRALSLLQTIVSANETQAKKLLGDTLYKEVKTTSDTTRWSTRKFTTAESSAVKKLLATDESKTAQDALANKDITSYVEQGKRLGIVNEPALVYFSDLANQGGSGAAGRVAASASRLAGGYPFVTLNELHMAAICDSVMGNKAYHSRRFSTYQYAAELGWVYCKTDDSYIPYNDITALGSGAAWVQRALNTCMNAGLTVSGVYDEATKTSVVMFQSAKGLTMDGYAGKETIVALIQAVVSNEAVDPQPPDNPPSSGDLPQPPDDPPVSVKPAEKGVLKAAKTSYGVNYPNAGFALEVTSNHAEAPITYQSSNEAVVKVSSNGQVEILGVGEAEITASQAQTEKYTQAQLAIMVKVYSTNPSDYAVPSGALYAGKNMKKQHVQWLQAAFITLGQGEVIVNGVWSDNMTKLVTDFQIQSAISADGIVGTQTQELISNMLAVKKKQPVITVKSSAAANTVSWKKYAKANRVYIFRKEKGTLGYQRIKTMTNMSKTSYQDKTAKKGRTYSYVVRYGYIQNKVKIMGPCSKGAPGKIK